MTTQKIRIPQGVNYLSNFTQTLPKGILNKGICGCGGSHLALTNQENYIVVVPYVNLIVNKTLQLNKKAGKEVVIDIWGGLPFESRLSDYLINADIPAKKIICTYDSFPKVAEAVRGYKFKVLVDEYHTLLHSYSYRDEAIDNLLRTVKKFDYVTYMSATPLEWDYTPEELKDVNMTEYVWEGSTKIKPQRIKSTQPYGKILSIIQNYRLGLVPKTKEGIKSECMYIYMNSVNAIMNVIKNAKMTKDEVRIICADTSLNESKLEGYPIGSPSDPEKMFNFITRSAFEGCDIYSATGMTYIVTNHSSNSTLLDISTDITQIVGRIRTESNPFKNEVVHIYNTCLAELSEKEFDEALNNGINQSNSLIAIYNALIEDDQRNALKTLYKDGKQMTYVTFNNEGKAVLNDIKIKSERYKYKEVRLSYESGLTIRDKYSRCDKFDMTNNVQGFSLDVFEYIKGMVTVGTFRDCAKEFCELAVDSLYYYKDERIEKILADYPEIEKIHAEIGSAKMKALSYKKDLMLAEMSANSKDAFTYLNNAVKKCFMTGNRYSNKDAKQRLQKIYDGVGLKKKAKASDLNEYFSVKSCKMSDRAEGLEILRPLNKVELDKKVADKQFKRMMAV